MASLDSAVSYAVQSAAEGIGRNLRFSNAYCVGLAEYDDSYLQALESPGDNFADGAPVAWCLRKAAGSRGALGSFRVRGPSFFEKTIAAGSNHNLRHSFIGSTDSTLSQLVGWISDEYPEAMVAGTYAPPFSPINEEFIKLIEMKIIEHDPQMVWLGLGTPKQDYVAMYLSERFPTLVIASVGAAFDFKAGVVREAPEWIQKLGFEWMFRLLAEPNRLWRRYSVGSLKFFRAVLRQRVASGRS